MGQGREGKPRNSVFTSGLRSALPRCSLFLYCCFYSACFLSASDSPAPFGKAGETSESQTDEV